MHENEVVDKDELHDLASIPEKQVARHCCSTLALKSLSWHGQLSQVTEILQVVTHQAARILLAMRWAVALIS